MKMLKMICGWCAVCLCFLSFMVGFVLPGIVGTFDRTPPYIITDVQAMPGKPGAVVRVTAKIKEVTPGRECSVVVNPQVLGEENDLAFANQTRLISGVLIHKMLTRSGGVFFTHLQVPPTVSSGTGDLAIDMDMRCADNFMHRLFPVQQTITTTWVVSPRDVK